MNSAPQKDEERGDGNERRNQKQRAVNGIARHHGQKPREDGGDGEDPEEDCFPAGKNH